LTPDDPAFWDDSFADDEVRPAGWDGASGKQRCVLAHAAEDGWLADIVADFLGEEVDGHVFEEIDRRRSSDGLTTARYALRPGREWKPSPDIAKIRAAVPEFAVIVRQLITDRVVEVRRMPYEHANWGEGDALSVGQVDRVLDDPESWLPGRATAGSVMISLNRGGPARKQFSGGDG
jgi:hypothetical protein